MQLYYGRYHLVRPYQRFLRAIFQKRRDKTISTNKPLIRKAIKRGIPAKAVYRRRVRKMYNFNRTYYPGCYSRW